MASTPRAWRTRRAIRRSGRRWSRTIPEILEGSTNKYQNWEVDRSRTLGAARLCGASASIPAAPAGRPASWTPNSPRETDDLYECIEWAGVQPWCNGKVGMLGISYYASNQWRVADAHPPHLAAIIPWEGQTTATATPATTAASSASSRRAGRSTRSSTCSTGAASAARKSRVTGESVAGPVTLSDEELAKNRVERLRGAEERIPSTTNGTAQRTAGPLQSRGAVPLLRELGRAGHPPARQLQRLHRSAARSRNGWKCTATRTGRCSPAATGWRCRSASSTTS